jgi:hypothetical protein
MENEGDASPRGEKAILIREALRRIFKKHWSIIVYDTFVEEWGSGTRFHYENKWWVYGVSTINFSPCPDNLSAFMKSRFGWAKIADVGLLQSAAEEDLRAKFGRSWNVHAVKFRPDSKREHAIWGQSWAQDGYTFYIMRQN